MLEVRNTFTPDSAKYAICAKQRKIAELRQARIDCMHRQKSDHPRYQRMTDEEFIKYRQDFARWTIQETHRIEEEIKKLEKWLEKGNIA